MASTVLYCKRCGVGYGSLGEVPRVCPSCEKETSWSTAPIGDKPTKPFVLTRNDRVFLKSLRIQPDELPDDHLGATERPKD